MSAALETGSAEPLEAFEYRTDFIRPRLIKRQHKHLADCFWLNRLTYNSTLEASRSYHRAMKRRLDLGLPVDKARLDKPVVYRHLSDVRNDQNHDLGLDRVPVTSLRAAADEALTAIAEFACRAARHESVSYPRFRSAYDRQQFKFSNFSLPGAPITDSPGFKASFLGLGLVRFRRHRPPPAGAKPVEFRFVRDRGGRIGARILWKFPRQSDEADIKISEAGQTLHEALKHLDHDCSSGALLDAAYAALPGRLAAADLGLSQPLTDDAGGNTGKVAVPKAEALRLKELQRAIARKPNKRSKRRRRLMTRLRALKRRHRNRLRTKAYQDAAWLAKRPRLLLVATEPNSMVRRLLGQVAEAAKDTENPKRSRMLRRRLHETGFSARLNRIRLLATAIGTLYRQPDYKGSSQDCSWCDKTVPKSLWNRTHACPHCGAVCGRDHNAARNLLARALRPFILSPDPDGAIAADLDRQRQAQEKQAQAIRRRREAAKKRWANQNGAVVSPAALERSGAEMSVMESS